MDTLLHAMLAATRFDGHHLYFENIPPTGALARLQRWPDLCLERSTDGAHWEKELLDFNLPLLHYHKTEYPEIAKWCDTIPPLQREMVTCFASSQLPALLLLQYPAGFELCSSNPMLYWLVCEVLDSRLNVEPALRLLVKKRTNLLSELSQRPSLDASALRLLSKIEPTPDTCRRRNRALIYEGIARQSARHALRHYTVVPLSVLKAAIDYPLMLAIPAVRSIVTSGCREDLARTLQLVEDIGRLRELLGEQANHTSELRHLQTLHQIEALHARLVTLVNQREPLTVEEEVKALKSIYGEVFPPPPLANSPVITAITTPEELLEEGKVMNHCVASYVKHVYREKSYIYKVLAPERATLEIKMRGALPTISQLYLANNKTPLKETREVVKRWLEASMYPPHS